MRWGRSSFAGAIAPLTPERNEVSQPVAGSATPDDAGVMSSTNLTINGLLEEALTEPDIGTTSKFRWHATAVGIAALLVDAESAQSPPFDEALKEGLQVGLDLSREEREFHQVKQGLVLLFHS